MLLVKNFLNILSKKIKIIVHIVLFNQIFRNLIVIPLLVSIFGGYIIFEIQKWDTIRSKKIECFENIIQNFNTISQIAFDDNAFAPITLLYNFNFEVANLLKSENALDKNISMDKISKMKLDYQKSVKQEEVQKKVLIQSIKREEILLKLYYGYSMKSRIIPLDNMITSIEVGQQAKKRLDDKLLQAFEEGMQFTNNIINKENNISNEEKYKKIKNFMNEKLSYIESEYANELKKANDGTRIRKEEAQKYIIATYNSFIDELNTPFYRFLNNMSRKKFSLIVDDTNK